MLLDNIRSAYNVGSILRTCDALGIKDVHFCGITPSGDDRQVQKTSLGAEKNIKMLYYGDTYTDIEALRTKGYKIIGLELSKRSIDLSEAPAGIKAVLVVGNEVSGLSEETMTQCDALIQIPMKGIKESLNVSVAFGIAAYELLR